MQLEPFSFCPAGQPQVNGSLFKTLSLLHIFPLSEFEQAPTTVPSLHVDEMQLLLDLSKIKLSGHPHSCAFSESSPCELQ